MSNLPDVLPGLPEPTRTVDPVAALRAAIATGPDHLTTLADAGDLGGCAHLLDAIRTIRQDLTQLEREAETATARLMDSRRVEIDGLTLERQHGTDRRLWQSGDLLRANVRDVVRDADGNLRDWDHPDELAGAIVARVEKVVPITKSLGWRVTGLREFGYDPDEWCESKPGRTSVQIASGGVG